MLYKDYKNNYGTCKTKPDSYDKNTKTITVFVPVEEAPAPAPALETEVEIAEESKSEKDTAIDAIVALGDGADRAGAEILLSKTAEELAELKNAHITNNAEKPYRKGIFEKQMKWLEIAEKYVATYRKAAPHGIR